MKTFRALVIASFLGFIGNAWCVIPENGWWWNSDESGRGFNLEIQDNLLFFAAFAYDATGAPAWMTAGGPMTTERDWTAPLYVTAHGQCFGCTYTPPQAIPAGTVSLHFTSSQTALLTVNGFTINVTRFDFWLNGSKPDAMLGEWSAVIGAAFDIFDGERIDYSAKQFGNDGTPFLAGYRLGSSMSLNPAVVYYDTAHQVWSALLDSSTSYYRLFIYNTTGFNRVEGSFWIYQKGTSPIGSGTFYQAFRTASAARIQTGNGPGSSKRTVDRQDDFESRDEQLYQRLYGAGIPKSAPPQSVVEQARFLEALLPGRTDRRQ